MSERLDEQQAAALAAASVAGGLTWHSTVPPDAWPFVERWLGAHGVRWLAVLVSGGWGEPAGVELFSDQRPRGTPGGRELGEAEAERRLMVWLRYRRPGDEIRASNGEAT